MTQSHPLQKLLAIIAVLSVMLLWLCAASVLVSPVHCKWLGVITLGFPFFVLAVVAMEAVLLLLARRFCWIPVAGLLVCYYPIRTYFPVNLPKPVPDGCIKVLSYNTCGYGVKQKDVDGVNLVAKYICQSQAHIVCLQEAYFTPADSLRKTMEYIGRVYPHQDSLHLGDNILSIFSVYPVVGRQRICQSGTNGAAVFRLLLAPDDTLQVVNCHLHSMHLSSTDRKAYVNLIRKENDVWEEADHSSRLLLPKISDAAVERARQADQVADYLSRHHGENILVCGDFNDSPVSYTHHAFTSQGLTDAYSESGNGLGRSFNRDAIIVRIDHILHSGDWKAYDCQVDESAVASDHYPITCLLKRIKR